MGLKIRKKVFPIDASCCISIPYPIVKQIEEETGKTAVAFDCEYNDDRTILLTPVLSSEVSNWEFETK